MNVFPKRWVPANRKPLWFLGAALVVGLLLRVYIIFVIGTAWGAEIFEYDKLARNLLAGQGYVIPHLGTSYQSFYSGIFYTLLTALLYAAFPWPEAAVLVVQSLLSALLALVVFSIGRKIWDDRVGALAGFLSFYHPGILYYDTHKLHPLSFDALSIAVATLALLSVGGPHYLRRGLVAGLLLGVAILQRGTMILLVLFGWVWLIRRLTGIKQICGGCAVFALGVGLVLAPWMARNYVIHGSPGLITLTPELFWRGNVSHSFGSSYLPSGRTVFEEAPEAFRRDVLERDEKGQYSYFLEHDISIIRAAPVRFVQSLLRKFFYFWTFAPQSGILYPASYFYVYNTYYFLVFVLAVLGVFKIAHFRSSFRVSWHVLALLMAVFLSVSLTQSVFYVEIRHRWGIEPLILILTSVGLISVWEWLGGSSRRVA